MLKGSNICVIDTECLYSADDCRHCHKELRGHYANGACEPWIGDKPADTITQFSPLGWNDKPALGLSIGCFFDYADSRLHWFDHWTLEATLRDYVTRAPLLVSFNGIAHDFPLMRGLLRRAADAGEECLAWCAGIHALCDTFKTLCATSYDILAAIWMVDPARKFEKGLNSLGALSVANDLGAKEMDGALAPRLWAQGRHAEVLNYCASDVYKTKGLFELIITQGSLLRGDGLPITLPRPVFPLREEVY